MPSHFSLKIKAPRSWLCVSHPLEICGFGLGPVGITSTLLRTWTQLFNEASPLWQYTVFLTEDLPYRSLGIIESVINVPKTTILLLIRVTMDNFYNPLMKNLLLLKDDCLRLAFKLDHRTSVYMWNFRSALMQLCWYAFMSIPNVLHLQFKKGAFVRSICAHTIIRRPQWVR